MLKIFILLCLTSLLSLNSHAKWSEVKKKKTIRIATEGAFAPFNYFKGKELTGFEVEIGNEIAKTLNLKVEWVTLPFESLLIGLGQDRFDLVIASHGITEKRAKSVDFTHPHYCTGGIILTREDGPTKKAQLSGKKLGVQVGTSYFEELQKLGKALEPLPQIQSFPKDTDVLTALMLGRLDAMVTDRFVAQSALEKHKNKNLQLGEMLFIEKVGMAAPKGDAETVAAINGALTQILGNGTYEKLSLKYFNQDVRCPETAITSAQ